LDALKMLTVETRKKENDRKIVVSYPGLLDKKTFWIDIYSRSDTAVDSPAE
jgi:hypothetical protein